MFPNPIIKLGSIEIYMYGVCIAIGILAAIIVLRLFGKKLNVDKKYLDFVEIDGYVAIALGFFFSAVFQGLYNYIADPSQGFSLKGGITFLGGLLGGAVTFFIIYLIFAKKYNGKFRHIISIVPCCILIAHGFGRIGCFCAGCCYGLSVPEGKWYSWMGVQFPEIAGKVLPTQLFEAIFLFIMFAVLAFLSLKKNYRHNFTIYLIGYGIWRFLIEFIRADERGSFIGPISPSQFWSIIMVLGGVGLIFFTNLVLFKDDKKVEIVTEETKVDNKPQEEAEIKADTQSESTNDAGDTLEEVMMQGFEYDYDEDEDEELDEEEKEDLEDLAKLDEASSGAETKSLDKEEVKEEKVEENKDDGDDKYKERMRRQLLAQKKLRDEIDDEPKKSVSLEEKLGKKK